MMWYGVLGTKELLHRTYRNLEQKVLLEVSTGPPTATGGGAAQRPHGAQSPWALWLPW